MTFLRAEDGSFVSLGAIVAVHTSLDFAPDQVAAVTTQGRSYRIARRTWDNVVRRLEQSGGVIA